MKCAEVMEWMHRYLDHDLSQDEIIEMFRHIDNCPSCADVFDRLSVLSQQLEQLPDVKPPFSLVDSILPQLDKLDQGVQEPTMKSIDESKVAPFTRKNSRGKFFKGSSMAARTGIGAAAAAVILLIAIFNMPDSMPAADMDMALNKAADTNSGQTMQKTDEATASGPVAAQDGSTDRAAGITEQNNRTFSAAENNPGVAEEIVTPSAVATPDSPAVAPDPTKEPASLKRQITVEPDTTTATPGVQDMRISSSDPDTSSGDNAQDSAPESKAGADNPESESKKLPSSEEAGVMSLLPALVAPSPWTSPDGRFDAELAGQQLVLYSIPAGAARDDWKVLTSFPLEGEWVSGQWSEDSRVFTYVTLQNGSEITKTYTIPDSVVSPAPSGSPLPSSSAPAATPDAATSTN
ncbi:zf-HC2 domain-containing protein [Paenibacillus sp. sgz5001063]|uniref:anti-sigma factor family protein n=1 Tax=Paenibacillus sp. sgz5001063 TaxID=3242474 RepID=UPI0036D2D1D4